ncbi:hypothetical protein H2200_008590 [Cladophialophora chaetospira]|uniref:Uncharacterized protein n=1 Tax=Cladophialophora chaetospira TaxID=386627 RepID=A0AA38X4C0_9EURO|nr:hypothetical protein H2200_008590 [Cladophialophora chaetospira]
MSLPTLSAVKIQLQNGVALITDYNAQLINCPKPLICAVNGPCAGYGMSTLALFDIVYSVPQAYFFVPFVKWGLIAEGGSSISFVATMGYQKAAWLILTGERIGAVELENAGLISKILPEEDFLQSVLAKAELMAQSPPETLEINKEIIRAPMRQALLDANDRECEMLRRQMAGEESKVALRAFAEEQEKKKRARSTPKL